MYFDLSALNDGITQDERRMKALMPGFISVDERDIADLLKFMTGLAAQFNYYSLNNKPDGNWEDFFKSDIHVQLILISRFDMSAQINQFSEFEDEIYMAGSEKALFTSLHRLFDFILNVLNMLDELHERLLNLSNGGKMVSELTKIVDTFDNEILRLNAYNEEARKEFGEGLKINTSKYVLAPGTGHQDIKTIFSEGSTPKERIVNALPEIKALFTDLGTKCNHLLGVTKFYLKSNDLLEGHYTPHLALCVAFLHLYMHLQRQLNASTKNHLDFYYKQILGLQLKKAVPDNVHLIFEKDALLPVAELKAGEELLAHINGQQEPAIFVLNESLQVTDAQIAELKTLFLADRVEMKNKEGALREVQIYNGSYECSTAAAFLKNKNPVKTWPVLGEDQEGLSTADQTMELSDIGLLLTSPVLYLVEGQRTISIYIDLDNSSFQSLMAYFTEFSMVTKMDLVSVNHQLLSTTFIIDYTDTKGWKGVPKYNASLNIILKRLEIEIPFNKADQIIDVYNPEVHGNNFDIEWPVFRLLLNHFAMNNPLTFLRNIKMERITIRVSVNGSKIVKLQNNIGPLSAANPGQLFGPQPSVGSYLDIKSSNIFNKYIRNFCIRFDWTDLPKEPGGWETYYKAYNNNISNSSFSIKVSTFTDGRFVPAVQQQEEFSLFETGDDGILSNTTQLQNIDYKRLGFNKRPLLNKEETAINKNFTEGALRIELTAPNDAFGHRLFPQIFPQVVLHNAKHSKKLPLPNQPYIPLIRALSIDYVLEHSEALGGGAAKNTAEDDLKVFHIYPFGYENIYPGKRGSPYYIIPDFDYENNLYLGLKNIKAGQQLSILFQLKENNFSNIQNTEPIIWSYLDDNVWIRIDEKDVLLDATNNLINTGIVKIKLPADLKTGNTILSPQLYWIRASAKGKTNVKSNIIAIYTQAATAQRLITDTPAALNIPASSIKMFKRRITGIQSVIQPFPSFGGKNAETDEQYYVRVSERLRHGQKLLTDRDIEQAILERFPEILLAKCISQQEYSNSYIEKFRPGLRVILIPKEQANGLFTSDEPKVNLSVRYQVKKFLEKSVQSFLNIQIESPVYERIKIVCTVKFTGDNASDNGMYLVKLDKDIKRYLCPWLYVEGSAFKIGSGIYMSEILNYIKKLDYVQYVTGFSIVHFYFDSTDEGDEKKARVIEYIHDTEIYIKGSLPETVLIPNKSHLIIVADDTKPVEPRDIGISEFAVLDELLVNKDTEEEKLKDTQAKASGGFFDLIISRNID